MSEQGTLFDPETAREPVAHARHTDPETSHEAAASVHDISESQEFVLRLFRLHGPMAHHEVVRLLRACESWPDWVHPVMSESGIRTRTSELVALGKLRDSGKRTLTKTGRKAIVWEVAC